MKKGRRKSKQSKGSFRKFMHKFLEDILIGAFGGFVFYILQAFTGLSQNPFTLGVLLALAIVFISGWCFILGLIMWWFRQRR